MSPIPYVMLNVCGNSKFEYDFRCNNNSKSYKFIYAKMLNIVSLAPGNGALEGHVVEYRNLFIHLCLLLLLALDCLHYLQMHCLVEPPFVEGQHGMGFREPLHGCLDELGCIWNLTSKSLYQPANLFVVVLEALKELLLPRVVEVVVDLQINITSGTMSCFDMV